MQREIWKRLYGLAARTNVFSLYVEINDYDGFGAEKKFTNKRDFHFPAQNEKAHAVIESAALEMCTCWVSQSAAGLDSEMLGRCKNIYIIASRKGENWFYFFLA